MTPVIPCSTSNFFLIPGTGFTSKKDNRLRSGSLARKSTKYALSSQKLVLPLPTSVRLLQKCSRNHASLHRSVVHIVSATGTGVAVEETDSPAVDEASAEASDGSTDEVDATESSTKSDASPPAQSRRSRPGRKSEMPPVKDEDLVPGATFTGKVRSIQPFGAFVDFGAFTDGLVHVSRLSDSFVKDVGSIVSVGQEVKVRLVEANSETGRISLTMRDSDDISKLQQRKDSPAAASSDKPRPARRRKEEVKSSKFIKGQDLEGTVKNLTRSGTFISLPEGEEGFLPTAEEADDGLGSMMGASTLEVGQEVSVCVLRITRGQVTLTMKKEEDSGDLDKELNQGVVHVATNPFVLAFRKNKDIASFLDEREKAAKIPSKPKNSVEIKQVTETVNIADVQAPSSVEGLVTVPSTEDKNAEDEEPILNEDLVGAIVANDNVEPESIEAGLSQSVDISVEKEAEESSGILNLEGNTSVAEQIIEKAAPTDGVENDGKSESSDEIASTDLSSESPVDEVLESQPDDSLVKDEMQIQNPTTDNELSSAEPVEDEATGSTADENDGKKILENSEASGDSSEAQTLSSESQNIEQDAEKEVEISKNEVLVQTSAVETPSGSEVQDEKLESASVKNGNIGDSQGQNGSPSPMDSEIKVAATILPALVKQLREETGAGMMDCKKALAETGGDIVKAQEFLRKKGLASAEKKASRATAEGKIGSYIHDSRIGVLVEVNCETDFVSRGDIFKELVDDIAMQVAACPQVQYLVTEDVPEDTVNKEREIEMQKEDLLSKPEQIRSKIVEGRIRKRLEELALLEQPYIKNDKIVVKDMVKQTIATIGENIKVKRFVRYNLGEGLEKKSQDFAAEVAAQTAAKSVVTPAKEQPSEAEAKETAQKTPAVTVSAALVKQLREETGAGMMNCKKALSETGGDLEKAQEYLRKKGLSAADKKSSRLAAEGRIGSYIHDSRIGVLIEVNCETDFVGRSEKFKELVDDLAMQVVACPQVQFVSTEDIDESVVKKEKEIEMQREDLQSKPENIRGKIVEGRVSKRLGELVLLEQPFIKDDSILVQDLVKQTVAALGENIKVRRFVRFTLGETAEDA